MFVLKTSDRNQVEHEAGGGKGKQHSVGVLHLVSEKKMMINCIYFHVCGGAGGGVGEEEGKEPSVGTWPSHVNLDKMMIDKLHIFFMSVQNTSDGKLVEQGAGGGEEGKQCRVGGLHVDNEEKMTDKLHLFSCLCRTHLMESWWSRRQVEGRRASSATWAAFMCTIHFNHD
jgi:hypothetical protein